MQGVIMPDMWRTILREVIILYLCLAIFPVAVILFVIYNDSLSAGMAILSRGVLFWGAGQTGLSLAILVRLIAPYLIVQAIRAFRWSQRSLAGKKWANLYFSVLLVFLAGWAFWSAWDLFYFMYALGDIPAELLQFIRLEWSSVMICMTSSLLAFRCFAIFMDPMREAAKGSAAKRSNS
jgi:hypothetical protein